MIGKIIDQDGSPRSRTAAGLKTLATSVSARLREAILDGEIAPGAHLGLRELSASLGVSLSPLREALSRLSTEKLVLIEEQRGFRVAPVSAANCREIGRIRMELESLALGESIRNGDDEWEGTVAAAFHRLSKVEKRGWSPGEDKAEWEALNRNFHQSLMSASGMPLLMEMSATLSDMFDRYRRLFLAKQPPDPDVPSEHEAIFQATLARDSEKAMNLLRRHIERTSNNVLVFLARAESK
jgi:GntR family carbon starvation induced transcriptional regulator